MCRDITGRCAKAPRAGARCIRLSMLGYAEGKALAKVVVTGGAGFIGLHVLRALLVAGHEVRATLRDPGRAHEVRRLLAGEGVDAGGRLDFHTADLLSDEGWAGVMAGADCVLHVASPFPLASPEDENELIRPAREGTLRVLTAARMAGVKRVVVTSSFAAIGYGHGRSRVDFDETDWTDLKGADVQPYMKSKTLAERAAWDFMAREGGEMELSVVNPVAVFGPVPGPNLSTSVNLVRAMLAGEMPACPRIWFGVVDARDVADLHLKAMTEPAAAGQRFLASAGDCVSMHRVAQILREGLGAEAARVPRFQLPDFLVRLAALRLPMARIAVPQLGIVRNAGNAKARAMLGWTPRPVEEAILATAESLIRRGLVKV